MAGRKDASGLTPKMLAFCRAYIETGNQSEAYRRSYNTENMKAETVTKMASNLMADPRVSTMVTTMQGEADAKAAKELGLNREWVLSRIMKSAAMGLGEEPTPESANLAAANRALELLGKVDTIQVFVDRSRVTIEKTFEEKTDEELDEFIASNTK